MRIDEKSKKYARQVSLGHAQALLAIHTLLQEEKYRKCVLALRQKSGIPKDGFAPTTSHYKELTDAPPEWLPHLAKSRRSARFDRLAKDAQKLLFNLGYFTTLLIPSPILSYVFYNELIEVGFDARSAGIPTIVDALSAQQCCTYDANLTATEYEAASPRKKKEIDERRKILDKHYPIVLRIRKDATFNQVQDYLRRVFPFIDGLQERYRPLKERREPLRKRDKKSVIRDELITGSANKPWSETKKELNKHGFVVEKVEGNAIRAKHKRRISRLH